MERPSDLVVYSKCEKGYELFYSNLLNCINKSFLKANTFKSPSKLFLKDHHCQF